MESRYGERRSVARAQSCDRPLCALAVSQVAYLHELLDEGERNRKKGSRLCACCRLGVFGATRPHDRRGEERVAEIDSHSGGNALPCKARCLEVIDRAVRSQVCRDLPT